jgi:aminoglycoside 3-N-acetyltransferase
MSQRRPSRADVIEAVAPPVTGERLVRDMRELGVEPGQTLLVNASLSSMGWVEGGAPVVVAALREAVGPAGNVVVPTGTEQNSNFSRAHRKIIAGMSWDELRAYRKEMPAFNKDTTPSAMGAIAEALRTTPGAARSAHPQSSFAAIGTDACALMADHHLESHLGERSPLARLYDQDAQILMIGVGYKYCTALHLAEYRYLLKPPMQTYMCVVVIGGERHWTAYTDVVLDDNDFEEIGQSLAAEVKVKQGFVGHAECRLMPLRNTVHFAARWMARHRQVDPALMRVGDLCKL